MKCTVEEMLRVGCVRLKQDQRMSADSQMESEMLLAAVCKRPREWIIAHPEGSLTVRQKQSFDGFVNRRLRHEPIAYILGYGRFCGRDFRTDTRALIPRPETEELVALTLATMAQTDKRRSRLVLDIGTGCGAIAITIAVVQRAVEVIATDTSPDALALARSNARRLDVQHVHFLRANLIDRSVVSHLSRSPADELFVVANLPYLPFSDKRHLAPDIVRFEPNSALFAKRSGLALNETLIKQLAAWQKKDGRSLSVFLEFDPPQTRDLLRTSARYFPLASIHAHRDLCGRDRFLSIISQVLQTSRHRS